MVIQAIRRGRVMERDGSAFTRQVRRSPRTQISRNVFDKPGRCRVKAARKRPFDQKNSRFLTSAARQGNCLSALSKISLDSIFFFLFIFLRAPRIKITPGGSRNAGFRGLPPREVQENWKRLLPCFTRFLRRLSPTMAEVGSSRIARPARLALPPSTKVNAEHVATVKHPAWVVALAWRCPRRGTPFAFNFAACFRADLIRPGANVSSLKR